jgi:hypothetical protein
MDVDHDGQDATRDVGRFPGHVAALIGLFGTCDMMLEPQEGQRSYSFGGYHALRGPTSPFRGLTP